MLALGLPAPPLPPLLLDLDAEGLRLGAHDGRATLKHPLVDVRRALQGEVAATENARAVQAQHVARLHAGHTEGQTDLVALADEVGEAVDVHGDVMLGLGGEKGEESLDRVGYGGGRRRGMALLEGQGPRLLRRRVGGILDVSLGDGLDDGARRVE